MKHFTILTLGFLLTGSVAVAQTTFEKSSQEFRTSQRTTPMVADFNNDGKMDIIYGGNYDMSLMEAGWEWQNQQVLCINNGDGTFTIDAYSYSPGGTDSEGNPVYNKVYNNHGIWGTGHSQYAGIDYNNDGLVDVLILGCTQDWDIFLEEEQRTRGLWLFKNLGDGLFELVEEANFPPFNPEDNWRSNAISVGDYDHDGYLDFVFTSNYGKGAEAQTERTVSLFRNLQGTGRFEDMKIATTKGGVKDFDGEYLEGHFLPMTGNVSFADINNDGWLDIISDGYADFNYDGVHPANGSMSKVYINNNGESFTDVTPDSEFLAGRASGSNFIDIDHDGYLDYYVNGYVDNHGYDAFLYYNNGGNFDEGISAADLGLDKFETIKQIIKDFDGDGILDMYYSGEMGCKMYYGQADGTFVKDDNELLPEYKTSFAAAGDFTGNGLSSIFMTGRLGIGDDNTSMAELYLNGNKKVESPEAPSYIEASLRRGTLNISWDYDTDEAIAKGLAYNIFVKKLDGSIFCLVPADPATGFVKVTQGKQVAIRPTIHGYSMTMEDEVAQVGVQVISLDNETYSPFTTYTLIEDAGVKSVAANSLKISSLGNALVVEGVEGEVKIFDVTGRLVGNGVVGEPIMVPAHGTFIVNAGGLSSKVLR